MTHGGMEDTDDFGRFCPHPEVCIQLKALLKLAVAEAGGHLVLTPDDVRELHMTELHIVECAEGLEARTQPRYPAV